MAAKANPALGHKLVSLLCLFALLFLAVPFAICAPMSHTAMPAMHCTECCPANAASAQASCCTSRPQADLPLSQTLESAPQAQAGVLQKPIAMASPSLYLTKPKSAPPPLLRTVLRI